MSSKKGNQKNKHRSIGNHWIAITKVVSSTRSFRLLSAIATKLYYDLIDKYTGRNNGDLSVAFKDMNRDYGWVSKCTLYRALDELLVSGFIIKTRQGGRNKCCLYALTAFCIDDCKGKMDPPWKETNVPPRGWAENPFPNKR